MYVPELKENFFLISMATEAGLEVHFKSNRVKKMSAYVLDAILSLIFFCCIFLALFKLSDSIAMECR